MARRHRTLQPTLRSERREFLTPQDRFRNASSWWGCKRQWTAIDKEFSEARSNINQVIMDALFVLVIDETIGWALFEAEANAARYPGSPKTR